MNSKRSHRPTLNVQPLSPSDDRPLRQGDIVVTAIAGRYAIGRVLEDGTSQVVLATESQSQRAITKARTIATVANRVILCWSAGTNSYRLLDCRDEPADAN